MATKIKSEAFTRVYHTLLSSGDKSFWITYKDYNGKKIWIKIGLYSNGIREKYCSNKRAEITNKMKLGENPSVVKNKRIIREVTTYDMIAHKYFEFKKIYLKKLNHQKLLSQYNRHIQPTIGNLPIEEITDEHIENIMILKESSLSNKTINMIVEQISIIFNYATKKKLFNRTNPVKFIDKLSVNNERERFLSKDEIKILLDKVRNNSQLYVFTYLSLTMGSRLVVTSEIQRKDIDLINKTITLQDKKSNSSYKGYIRDEFIDYLSSYIMILM